MKIKNVLIIFYGFAILLTACTRNEMSKHVPANVIKPEPMAELLADLHIADAGVSVEITKSDSAEIVRASYFYALLKKYNSSQEEFEESMEFYLSRPALLQDIYEKVNEIINTRQGVKIEWSISAP